MYQNLDARLVRVVAPPQHVIDAHYRFQIGQKFVFRHKFGELFGNEGRAPLTAADMNLITNLTGFIAHNDNADIVQFDGCAVMRMAGHRNFKLARQIRKFRMEGRPLPDDF